jgi:hypothetical protein
MFVFYCEKKVRQIMYAGASWIRRSLKKETSPLGEAVANLLGRVFLGIYHLPIRSLEKVDWINPLWIEIILGQDLSTIDGCHLTALVVLAHDKMIRVSIEGVGPGYMRLRFHQRNTRTGSICEQCPTIEDHIKIIRTIETAK